MKKFWSVIFCIALGAATLLGCDNARNGPQPGPINHYYSPVAYGNGLYYFPGIEEVAGKSIKTFIGDNPCLELKDMTGNGTGLFGADQGYWIYFKTKPNCPAEQ